MLFLVGRRPVNSAVMRPTPSLGMKPVASVLLLCFVTVATFTKPPDVIWRKFEELTKVSPQKNKEKLDALAVQLDNEDGAVAYLVSYAGRISCRREALTRARLVREYLASHGKVDPNRIKILDGGYRRDWLVELWVGHKLARPLTETYVDGRLSRNQVKVRAKCNGASVAF